MKLCFGVDSGESAFHLGKTSRTSPPPIMLCFVTSVVVSSPYPPTVLFELLRETLWRRSALAVTVNQLEPAALVESIYWPEGPSIVICILLDFLAESRFGTSDMMKPTNTLAEFSDKVMLIRLDPGSAKHLSCSDAANP